MKGWRRSAVTAIAPLTILAMIDASAPATASAHAPAATSVRAVRPAPAATATNAHSVAGLGSLTLSAAVQDRMLRLYVASRHIQVRDVARTLPGSVRAAQVTASGIDWASVSFLPSAHAPATVATGFQDGGGTGIYTRSPRGEWKLAGLGGEPSGCAEHLPAAVRKLWNLGSCIAPSGRRRPHGAILASGNKPGDLANSYLGVADNPASTDLTVETDDCNPFTALVSTTGGKGSPNPCGYDSQFKITDRAEFWCSDFAEYVWQQTGIPGTSALSPSSSSFYTYGHNYHESMPADPSYLPAPGDAVVFYPSGVSPSGAPGAADHIGIVYSVDASAGTIDLINGDWGGGSNISVKEAANITLSTDPSSWAQQQWGHAEEWIYVAPAASASVDSGWDNEFQSYGDTSGAWSGGDGAQALQLPNGNTTWFFADTYLGQTDPDGTRPPLSTGVAHNSAVLYNANTGNLGPTSAVGPGSNGYYFLTDYTWIHPPSGYPSDQYEMFNGDQVIDGGEAFKFYQLADTYINPDSFAYKLVGTVLESFSINGNTLTPQGGTPIGVEDTSGSNPIIWGTAVLVSGGYIYIYGTEPYNAPAGSANAYPLFLARVPVGGLAAGDAWQYYDAAPSCSPGSGAWSSSAGDASPLMPGGTSSGFSVTDVDGTDVLLTNDSTGTYNDAVAYYSSCPTGFSASSPEYPVYDSDVPSGYLTYEYRIVPQFSDLSGGQVLVSYSENTSREDASCMLQNYYDVTIYRPHFLDVQLPNLGGSGSATDPPDPPTPPSFGTPPVSPDKFYTQTDDYPGTSTPMQSYCVIYQTPSTSPTLSATSNSNDVIGINWSMAPTAMWMYSVVYCNVTVYGMGSKSGECPTNLVGSLGANLPISIPSCDDMFAPTPDCGYALDWGNTSSTVTSLTPGDEYEIQLETCLAVPNQGYVGSNVLIETAT